MQVKVDDEGLCRFGWATQQASFNLGTDTFGYGFGGTGMKSHGGKFEKYGEPFVQGDRVGCRLDLLKVRRCIKIRRDSTVVYLQEQLYQQLFSSFCGDPIPS